MPSPFTAESPSSVGDGTELAVLWESEVGLAVFLLLFLFLLVFVSVLELDVWVPAISVPCGSEDVIVPPDRVSCLL